MKCPLCAQAIHDGAELCPHCDRAGADLMDIYDEQPSSMRLLHDGAGILKVQERRQAENWIKKFNKEFPSCFLTIHSADLADHENVHSYGIWALNTPRYIDLPSSARPDAGICLVIDVHKKEVAMSYGYQLEPYLTEEACFHALSPAHPYLLDTAYFEALELMRHGIRKLIRGKARWAKSILKRKKISERIVD